mmetsp:Transcript_58105/g.189210  ORF Transcript_58105/g.189210 Transcript_58105/m.189210 type:complete len:288 (+) Transcript_58105:1354-2217(+)
MIHLDFPSLDDGESQHGTRQDVGEGDGLVVRRIRPIDADDVGEDHQVVNRFVDCTKDDLPRHGPIRNLEGIAKLQIELGRVQEEQLDGCENRQLPQDRLELHREEASDLEARDAEGCNASVQHDVGFRRVIQPQIKLHLQAIMSPGGSADRPKLRAGVPEGAMHQFDVLQRTRECLDEAWQNVHPDELLQASPERGPDLLGDPAEPGQVAALRGVGARGEQGPRDLGVVQEVQPFLHLELQPHLEHRRVAPQRRGAHAFVDVEAVQNDDDLRAVQQVGLHLQRLILL